MRQDGGRGSAVGVHELGSRWLAGGNTELSSGDGAGLQGGTQTVEGRNVERIASSRFPVRSISRVETCNVSACLSSLTFCKSLFKYNMHKGWKF